jgi:hypothetical protein
MDDAIADLITFVVTVLAHAWVLLLLVAIVAANLYALVHSWRSGRAGWFLVILLTGGGIATGVYLVMHHDEPLSSRSSARTGFA